jgi:hypothetical protein
MSNMQNGKGGDVVGKIRTRAITIVGIAAALLLTAAIAPTTEAATPGHGYHRRGTLVTFGAGANFTVAAQSIGATDHLHVFLDLMAGPFTATSYAMVGISDEIGPSWDIMVDAHTGLFGGRITRQADRAHPDPNGPLKHRYRWGAQNLTRTFPGGDWSSDVQWGFFSIF